MLSGPVPGTNTAPQHVDTYCSMSRTSCTGAPTRDREISDPIPRAISLATNSTRWSGTGSLNETHLVLAECRAVVAALGGLGVGHRLVAIAREYQQEEDRDAGDPEQE